MTWDENKKIWVLYQIQAPTVNVLFDKLVNPYPSFQENNSISSCKTRKGCFSSIINCTESQILSALGPIANA